MSDIIGTITPPSNPLYGQGALGLGSFLSRVNKLVAAVCGIVLFFYLLYGGFRYISAGGDEKAVQEAGRIITNAIVGMLIVAAAYIITLVIEEILGIDIFSLSFG